MGDLLVKTDLSEKKKLNLLVIVFSEVERASIRFLTVACADPWCSECETEELITQTLSSLKFSSVCVDA